MKSILIWLAALLLPAMGLAEAAPPSRVVSLYGSYAEAWLQAGGSLVGVTEDALTERKLPLDENCQVIGTTKSPNLEMILSLDPDWVILSADIAGHENARRLLEQAGVPCKAYRVDSWQDYDAMMDEFTRLTGRRDLYEELLPPMAEEISRLTAEAALKASPTVLLLRAYSSGVKAKAEDNLAGLMIRDLNGDNIAARQPSLLENISLEAIAAEDPQVILISIMGQDTQAALQGLEASLGSHPVWQGLSAVQSDRVYVLPKELFHYKPNARWGESYGYLFQLLYGPSEP